MSSIVFLLLKHLPTNSGIAINNYTQEIININNYNKYIRELFLLTKILIRYFFLEDERFLWTKTEFNEKLKYSLGTTP